MAMDPKRTSHSVYDMKYHFVWTLKYPKLKLRGDIRTKVKEILHEIAFNHDIEIVTLEIAEDHDTYFSCFCPGIVYREKQGC